MHGQVDAVVLDPLEAPDGLAENHAGSSVLQREVKNLLTRSDLEGAQYGDGLLQ